MLLGCPLEVHLAFLLGLDTTLVASITLHMHKVESLCLQGPGHTCGANTLCNKV